MITEISQRWFFTKRKIVICDANVIVQHSNLTNLNEKTIPYETIAGQKESYTTQLKHLILYIRITLYTTSIGFLLRNLTEYLSHVYIYSFVAFVGLIIYHFVTREKVWKIKLENNTYIILNKKIPNEDAVNDFIETLFRQRNQYLRETYLFFNENMPYEPQFRNLQWLRQIGVIDTEEFNAKRKKLDALFNDYKKPIEFFLN